MKKDQLLAKVDPRLLSAAVERDKATLATQKAELARVDAQLQQARNNEERARKLASTSKDFLSDTEMDQYRFGRMALEAQRELALASIAQAQASLKNSEANLGYTEIRSPVDGIVIDRKVDPGQTMAAAFQTPEMFIVAPDLEKHVYIYANVDEADIGQIKQAKERGHAVKFTVDAYRDDLFEGKISQVRMSSTTTQNVVTYPVVIEASNPGLKLMPGMTASVTFLIEGKDNVLQLPAAALRFVPQSIQVRPEDRHYLDSVPTTPTDEGVKLSATEKAILAKENAQ